MWVIGDIVRVTDNKVRLGGWTGAPWQYAGKVGVVHELHNGCVEVYFPHTAFNLICAHELLERHSPEVSGISEVRL